MVLARSEEMVCNGCDDLATYKVFNRFGNLEGLYCKICAAELIQEINTESPNASPASKKPVSKKN